MNAHIPSGNWINYAMGLRSKIKCNLTQVILERCSESF
jgi:hypothetical protein